VLHKHDLLPLLKKKGFAIVISIAIFYIMLATFADISTVSKYIHQLKFHFVLLILLSFSASIILRSIRQFLILRYIDINLSFRDNLVLYVAGLSMSITPLSLGQSIKSHYLLKNQRQPISKTLPIVLVERYYDVLALFSFTALFVALNNVTILRAPVISIGVLLAIVAAAVSSPKILATLVRLASRTRLIRKFEKDFASSAVTLSILFSRDAMCTLWLLSIVGWFFEAVGIFLCFQSLGVNFLSFGLSTVFGFSATIFGALSFIPGGIGITEISFVKILSYYGLGVSTATAVILLVRLSSLWYSTVIGFIATRFVGNK
jgi:glycosyltransferase 2 family protein